MLANTKFLDSWEIGIFVDECMLSGYWCDEFLSLTDSDLSSEEKSPYFYKFLYSLKWKSVNDEKQRLKFLTTFHARNILFDVSEPSMFDSKYVDENAYLFSLFDYWYFDVGQHAGDFSGSFVGSQIGMEHFISSYWLLNELPSCNAVSTMGEYDPRLIMQRWLNDNPEFSFENFPLNISLFRAMKIT